MKVLSNDQEARVRFAYRVWSTGSTYGAPASIVRDAWDLIDHLALEGAPTSQESFTRLATQVLNKLEN